MDDNMMREMRAIHDVMLGGYLVATGINRIACDCQRCRRIAKHTATSELGGRFLERHLCDEHLPVFNRFYHKMEQPPPELPLPADVEC